ncbi:hypothetical protein PanWU01x14_161170 [Parasponia andersonii]|uniref:Uncharacterized protein n=1 Tax=Parasponia andersonii TaxID=3476 RepID=A0A2P5CDR1_PARAD|nr:hypothetical protein PanWU01x14_161170 [Parasponia andersonii]
MKILKNKNGDAGVRGNEFHGYLKRIEDEAQTTKVSANDLKKRGDSIGRTDEENAVRVYGWCEGKWELDAFVLRLIFKPIKPNQTVGVRVVEIILWIQPYIVIIL